MTLLIRPPADEDIETVADGFTVSGSFTDTRTLDVTTPTTANIAAVLATFPSDLKSRGQTRTEPCDPRSGHAA